MSQKIREQARHLRGIVTSAFRRSLGNTDSSRNLCCLAKIICNFFSSPSAIFNNFRNILVTSLFRYLQKIKIRTILGFSPSTSYILRVDDANNQNSSFLCRLSCIPLLRTMPPCSHPRWSNFLVCVCRHTSLFRTDVMQPVPEQR